MTALFQGRVTRKDWIFIAGVAAAIVVTVLVFWFVIHASQLRRIASIEAEDAQVTGDLQEALLKKKNFAQLQDECNKTQALLSEFHKRLPSGREIPRLLSQFEALAKEVGLEVELKPLPAQRDERKETVPYSVKAFGNFHQIASFINRLERYERFLKVSDLAIKEEKQGVAEASFRVTTFRIIEAPEEQASQAQGAQPQTGLAPAGGVPAAQSQTTGGAAS